MASQPVALRLPTASRRGATKLWRRLFAGPPPQARAEETPFDALNTSIESWTRKAHWNKRAARRGTRAIVLSSTAIPVVLLISVNVHGVQVGQVLASLLAAGSTAAAAFLQFNRPYADWSLYREYQRWGERERFAFHVGLEPYDSDDQAEKAKLLAEKLYNAHRDLELRRTALIPDDGDISRLSAARR